MKKTGKIILSEDESFFGENLFEEKVFPKPLSKTFLVGEWEGWSTCNSGASRFVGTNYKKIVCDLVTSAQWDVGVEFLV